MDGVLIDSEPIHMACEKEIFKMLGICVPEEEHHSMIGTTDGDMWTRLKVRYNLLQPVNELVQLKQTYYNEWLRSKTILKPISYIPDLILKLHSNDYLLAVASSATHAQINFILKEFGLKNFFNVVVGGNEVNHGKPNPEIFLKASKLLGVSPQHCIVIEDSTNGVKAAKKANMYCIGYRNPNSGNQDLQSADMVIDSFSELDLKQINELSNF
jgi:HAD superfamily hydrolase (TIGR01509 family)